MEDAMSLTTRNANVGLWIAQGTLAAIFLFAGGYKLATPLHSLAQMTPFPPLFIKFIGACEVAGALGLILPGIFHTHTSLTPLAASGLTIIMIGAVITTVMTMGLKLAIFPLIVGFLAITIARGRSSRAQQRREARGFTVPIPHAGGR
jgi:hypothetical protein